MEHCFPEPVQRIHLTFSLLIGGRSSGGVPCPKSGSHSPPCSLMSHFALRINCNLTTTCTSWRYSISPSDVHSRAACSLKYGTSASHTYSCIPCSSCRMSVLRSPPFSERILSRSELKRKTTSSSPSSVPVFPHVESRFGILLSLLACRFLQSAFHRAR